MIRYLKFLPRVFLKGTSPLHLTYFVTDVCDSRCAYCFSRRRSGAEGKVLSAAEVEKVARSLSSPLLWLLLSGGEPFLHPEIEDICAAFYRHARPAFLVIPTNCLRPDAIVRSLEKIAVSCPRSTVVLKLSLDGWGEDHDRLRGVPGNFEGFLATGAAAARVRLRHPNLVLGVNTVILPQNFSRLSELKRKVVGLPWVNYHNFSLARGAGVDSRWTDVDPDEYRRFSLRLREEGRRAARGLFSGEKFKAAQDFRQREIVFRVLQENRRQLPCYAGRLNLVLGERGDVYPCEMLPWKLGNVRESGYDLKAIISGEEARKCRRAIADGLEACDRCTNECYLITNILFNPRELFRVWRSALGLP